MFKDDTKHHNIVSITIVVNASGNVVNVQTNINCQLRKLNWEM